MAEQQYVRTAILYKFLSEIQTFQSWENAFIFEYFDMYYAKRFYRGYKLMYMSDLTEFNDSLDPEVIYYYKHIIKNGIKKWNKIIQQQV